MELHNQIEAMKLAYSDLYRYNADSALRQSPRPRIDLDDYASQRAKLIDPDKASCTPASGTPRERHHLSCRGRPRRQYRLAHPEPLRRLRFRESRSRGGVHSSESRRAFRARSRHPNASRPANVRFTPSFLRSWRRAIHIGFGIMGGSNQPLAHAQFVSNFVDYGMNIQAALEPRFTVRPTEQGIGCDIIIESRVPAETLTELEKKGHQFKVRKEYSTAMGRGQAVLHNSKSNVNFAASDPRADGSAEPEPVPEH